jgi:hypothetical protein
MKQRSRIWDVIIFSALGLILAATVYAALQPVSLEQYTTEDSAGGLRLKMNRNQERIQLGSEQQRIAIDTNAVIRVGHAVCIGTDTISLPLAFADSDYVVLPIAKQYYGSAPTSGITAHAINDSLFEIYFGGTDDSVTFGYVAIGSVLGRE